MGLPLYIPPVESDLRHKPASTAVSGHGVRRPRRRSAVRESRRRAILSAAAAYSRSESQNQEENDQGVPTARTRRQTGQDISPAEALANIRELRHAVYPRTHTSTTGRDMTESEQIFYNGWGWRDPYHFTYGVHMETPEGDGAAAEPSRNRTTGRRSASTARPVREAPNARSIPSLWPHRQDPAHPRSADDNTVHGDDAQGDELFAFLNEGWAMPPAAWATSGARHRSASRDREAMIDFGLDGLVGENSRGNHLDTDTETEGDTHGGRAPQRPLWRSSSLRHVRNASSTSRPTVGWTDSQERRRSRSPATSQSHIFGNISHIRGATVVNPSQVSMEERRARYRARQVAAVEPHPLSFVEATSRANRRDRRRAAAQGQYTWHDRAHFVHSPDSLNNASGSSGGGHASFRSGAMDGLGDRRRSLSPEGGAVWDMLQATVTPDPQPPSVDSSFTSLSPAMTNARQAPVNARHAATVAAAAARNERARYGDEEEDGDETMRFDTFLVETPASNSRSSSAPALVVDPGTATTEMSVSASASASASGVSSGTTSANASRNVRSPLTILSMDTDYSGADSSAAVEGFRGSMRQRDGPDDEGQREENINEGDCVDEPESGHSGGLPSRYRALMPNGFHRALVPHGFHRAPVPNSFQLLATGPTGHQLYAQRRSPGSTGAARPGDEETSAVAGSGSTRAETTATGNVVGSTANGTTNTRGNGNSNTTGTPNDEALDLMGIGGMRNIVRGLALREDIPDEWWAEAGLTRTLPH